MTEEAKISITQGATYPFDASDEWSSGDIPQPAPPAKNWAHVAARGIIADLRDRRGIKQELNGLDEDVRVEIVETLTDIILEAAPKIDVLVYKDKEDHQKVYSTHPEFINTVSFFIDHGSSMMGLDIQKTEKINGNVGEWTDDLFHGSSKTPKEFLEKFITKNT